MSKLAVATALSVALGLGTVSLASAQGTQTGSNTDGGASTSQMQTGLPTGFRAPQTSTTQTSAPGKLPGTWQTNPTTGIGTFVPAGQTPPASSTTSTTTSTSTSATSTNTTKSATTSQSTSTGSKAATTTTTKGGAAPVATAAKHGGDVFTLQQSPTNVARTAGWQRFQNYLSLTTGQDQLNPLNLTITNSFFTKINVSLSGRPVATEKDFKNNSLNLNLAGALSVGENQLVIQAYGPVGSKITWRMTTAKPTVVSVEPKEIKIGEKFTVTGTNFAKVVSLDEVWLGKKTAAVTGATTKAITATVPKNAEAGDQNLIVRIGGMETKPFKVKIKKNPILKSLSQGFVAPGEGFTVYGEGLEGKQVEVRMGSLLAQVTSDGDDHISVIAPADTSNLWNVPDISAGPMWPVTVTVDGVEATGEKLSIEAHNI